MFFCSVFQYGDQHNVLLTNVKRNVHVDQANSSGTVEDQTYFIRDSDTNEHSVNVSAQLIKRSFLLLPSWSLLL